MRYNDVIEHFMSCQTAYGGNYFSDGYGLYLFGNRIACHTRDGLVITPQGWTTATTSKALNKVIANKKSNWYRYLRIVATRDRTFRVTHKEPGKKGIVIAELNPFDTFNLDSLKVIEDERESRYEIMPECKRCKKDMVPSRSGCNYVCKSCDRRIYRRMRA